MGLNDTVSAERLHIGFFGIRNAGKSGLVNAFTEQELSGFSLVVHCGGCMLNEKEMRRRVEAARSAGVPIVNYGVAIAHMHGILERSLQPFPEALPLLNGTP